MKSTQPVKPSCANCRRRLNFVLSACVCRNIYCRNCIDPKAHACKVILEETAPDGEKQVSA